LVLTKSITLLLKFIIIIIIQNPDGRTIVDS